jgi:CheY-like chemotaxis protein
VKEIVLIHWKAEEAAVRVHQLKGAGFSVRQELQPGPDLLRRLSDSPPAAVIIDLTRLPSHGREVGIALRQRASTRSIPLIFAEGEYEKAERIRRILPDAQFSSWEEIGNAIQTAIAKAPENPVAPSSIFAAYAGTPLPKKLGIKPGFRVALVHPPDNIEESLGPLPESVSFEPKPDAKSRLILWFVKSQAQLESEIAKIASSAINQPVWIFWPKKVSQCETNLTQQAVRETGLGAGLVDYKICAFDATWSGLLFKRRA